MGCRDQWFGYKRVLFYSLSLLPGTLVLGFSIYDVVDYSTILNDLKSSGVATGRLREGLWLTVVAAAGLEAAIVGALAGTVLQRKRRRREVGVMTEPLGTPGGGGTDDDPPSVPIGGATG